MGIYNIHGGHSLQCRGASGFLDEVNEDRKVKNKVIELLRSAGHTVYDCTDDIGRTQGQNLNNIKNKCNVHNVDLDVSIHLNSGRNDPNGDGKTGGVTVIKQLLFRIVSVQIYHQHLVLQTVGQNIPMDILFSTILRHLLF